MTDLDHILKKAKITLDDVKPHLKHRAFDVEYEKRDNFEDLKECYDNFYTLGAEPRMIGLSGLRGTGKTTLLWQIANYTFGQGKQKEVYYFNVETIINLGYRIFDIYWHIEKTHPEFNHQKVVLLFDEVHADPNWSKALKIIYDEMPLAYIVATGSSALLLQTTADLATRMLILHTFPLDFSEYISITKNIKLKNKAGFQKKLKETLFFADDIDELKQNLEHLEPLIIEYYKQLEGVEELIEDYIKYHNIVRFSLHQNKNFIVSELDNLYHRVIYEDIPSISTGIKPVNSKKILMRLAASDEINVQSLSQVFGIGQEEINQIIEVLAKAELINVLYPYGGVDSKLNKKKKTFFMSPSIRLAMLSEIFITEKEEFKAKFYEDIVVMYMRRFFDDALLSFSSYKDSKNPDFVIETLLKPMLLEVGTNKKSIKQITKSKIKYRYGIVVNTQTNELEFKQNSVILPLKYFLLL